MRVNGESKGSPDHNQRVSVGVLWALAEAEGVDPVEFEPQLYTVIDPDALDALFRDDHRPGAGNVEVTFEYVGREIRIAESGEITVSERLDGSPSGPDHDQPR